MSSFNIIKDYYNYTKLVQLSIQEYESLCLKKLHKLLHHALSYSPFYKKLYKDHGISEKDIEKLSIDDLPTTNKSMLMDNFDEVVTDPEIKKKDVKQRILFEPEKFQTPFLGKYYLLRTSGTTGEIGMFVYSVDALNFASRAAIIRSSDFLENILSRKKIAFCGAKGYFLGAIGVSSLKNFLVDNRIISSLNSQEELTHGLELYQPNYIVCYSSVANFIAEEVFAGRLHIKPLVIKCSADPLYPAYRQAIKEAFPSVKIENNYTGTEFGLIAKQSELDDNFINFKDLCWLDEKSHSLTNMYNLVFPTIKYTNGDCFSLAGKGSSKDPFDRIKLGHCRENDSIHFLDDDGNPADIHWSVFLDFYTEGLKQFQFWQKEQNVLLVKISGTGEHLVDDVTSLLKKIIRAKRGEKALHLKVEKVEKFENDQVTGKFKMFNILNNS